jgi:hypothetical protein
MKATKTILTLLSLFLVCSYADAQNNCPGDKIKVFKGGNGCGCHCQKECVTPADLPTYLADGWNTTGCWNCCKFKNWVDVSNPKTTLDEINPNAKNDSLTVSFTLATVSKVKIQIMDMTSRNVATIANQFFEDQTNELSWDHSSLEPGMYLLLMESTGYSETKKIAVLD